MATSIFAGESSGGSQGRAMAEMNITPLVDVMLVLLVIFMVAAPLATRSIELRLPQRGEANVPPPHLRLGVRNDGQFSLDGVVLGKRALASALGEAARAEPGTVVDVDVNEDADYQAFTTALAVTRNSGIRNIAMK